MAPGIVRTSFHAQMTEAARECNLRERIALHREGRSEDVASLIVELVTNVYGLTDSEPGEIRAVLDANQDHRPIVTRFEAEGDRGDYGHRATVIRYQRHFQDCLDHDREPSPSVIDGAKSVAVGVAAGESVWSGKIVEVCNEFQKPVGHALRAGLRGHAHRRPNVLYRRARTRAS